MRQPRYIDKETEKHNRLAELSSNEKEKSRHLGILSAVSNHREESEEKLLKTRGGVITFGVASVADFSDYDSFKNGYLEGVEWLIGTNYITGFRNDPDHLMRVLRILENDGCFWQDGALPTDFPEYIHEFPYWQEHSGGFCIPCSDRIFCTGVDYLFGTKDYISKEDFIKADDFLNDRLVAVEVMWDRP